MLKSLFLVVLFRVGRRIIGSDFRVTDSMHPRLKRNPLAAASTYVVTYYTGRILLILGL